MSKQVTSQQNYCEFENHNHESQRHPYQHNQQDHSMRQYQMDSIEQVEFLNKRKGGESLGVGPYLKEWDCFLCRQSTPEEPIVRGYLSSKRSDFPFIIFHLSCTFFFPELKVLFWPGYGFETFHVEKICIAKFSCYLCKDEGNIGKGLTVKCRTANCANQIHLQCLEKAQILREESSEGVLKCYVLCKNHEQSSNLNGLQTSLSEILAIIRQSYGQSQQNQRGQKGQKGEKSNVISENKPNEHHSENSATTVMENLGENIEASQQLENIQKKKQEDGIKSNAESQVKENKMIDDNQDPSQEKEDNSTQPPNNLIQQSVLETKQSHPSDLNSATLNLNKTAEELTEQKRKRGRPSNKIKGEEREKKQQEIEQLLKGWGEGEVPTKKIILEGKDESVLARRKIYGQSSAYSQLFSSRSLESPKNYKIIKDFLLNDKCSHKFGNIKEQLSFSNAFSSKEAALEMQQFSQQLNNTHQIEEEGNEEEFLPCGYPNFSDDKREVAMDEWWNKIDLEYFKVPTNYKEHILAVLNSVDATHKYQEVDDSGIFCSTKIASDEIDIFCEKSIGELGELYLQKEKEGNFNFGYMIPFEEDQDEEEANLDAEPETFEKMNGETIQDQQQAGSTILQINQQLLQQCNESINESEQLKIDDQTKEQSKEVSSIFPNDAAETVQQIISTQQQQQQSDPFQQEQLASPFKLDINTVQSNNVEEDRIIEEVILEAIQSLPLEQQRENEIKVNSHNQGQVSQISSQNAQNINENPIELNIQIEQQSFQSPKSQKQQQVKENQTTKGEQSFFSREKDMIVEENILIDKSVDNKDESIKQDIFYEITEPSNKQKNNSDNKSALKPQASNANRKGVVAEKQEYISYYQDEYKQEELPIKLSTRMTALFVTESGQGYITIFKVNQTQMVQRTFSLANKTKYSFTISSQDIGQLQSFEQAITDLNNSNYRDHFQRFTVPTNETKPQLTLVKAIKIDKNSVKNAIREQIEIGSRVDKFEMQGFLLAGVTFEKQWCLKQQKLRRWQEDIQFQLKIDRDINKLKEQSFSILDALKLDQTRKNIIHGFADKIEYNTEIYFLKSSDDDEEDSDDDDEEEEYNGLNKITQNQPKKKDASDLSTQNREDGNCIQDSDDKTKQRILKSDNKQKMKFRKPQNKLKKVDHKKKKVGEDQKKKKKKKEKEQLETDCMVCFSQKNNDNNPVVYCSECQHSFHKVCYGIQNVPEGKFYCDACHLLNTLKPKDKQQKEAFLSRLKCPLCIETDIPIKLIYQPGKCNIDTTKIKLEDLSKKLNPQGELWMHPFCMVAFNIVRFRKGEIQLISCQFPDNPKTQKNGSVSNVLQKPVQQQQQQQQQENQQQQQQSSKIQPSLIPQTTSGLSVSQQQLSQIIQQQREQYFQSPFKNDKLKAEQTPSLDLKKDLSFQSDKGTNIDNTKSTVGPTLRRTRRTETILQNTNSSKQVAPPLPPPTSASVPQVKEIINNIQVPKIPLTDFFKQLKCLSQQISEQQARSFDSISSDTDIFQQSYCNLCGSNYGSTLKCSQNECEMFFHPLCAFFFGLSCQASQEKIQDSQEPEEEIWELKIKLQCWEHMQINDKEILENQNNCQNEANWCLKQVFFRRFGVNYGKICSKFLYYQLFQEQIKDSSIGLVYLARPALQRTLCKLLENDSASGEGITKIQSEGKIFNIQSSIQNPEESEERDDGSIEIQIERNENSMEQEENNQEEDQEGQEEDNLSQNIVNDGLLQQQQQLQWRGEKKYHNIEKRQKRGGKAEGRGAGSSKMRPQILQKKKEIKNTNYEFEQQQQQRKEEMVVFNSDDDDEIEDD